MNKFNLIIYPEPKYKILCFTASVDSFNIIIENDICYLQLNIDHYNYILQEIREHYNPTSDDGLIFQRIAITKLICDGNIIIQHE